MLERPIHAEGTVGKGGSVLPSLPRTAPSLPSAIVEQRPYIWVTWMTKLISGDASCDFSLWFRARHKYEKLSPGFELTRWTHEHDELVRSRASDLKAVHLTPTLEKGMTVQGRSSTVSGRPDIRYELKGNVVF
jgi:hypothetical protein